MIEFARNNRGFTLLELMMAAALLGIFFIIVYGFLNQSLRFLNQRNVEHDAYNQARIAMFRLSNYLRQYEKLDLDGKVVMGDVSYPLVDFNKNSANPGGVKYYFFWDDSKGVGEMRTSDDQAIARGIKTFEVSELEVGGKKLIYITIQAVPFTDHDDQGLTLSTMLNADRHYVP